MANLVCPKANPSNNFKELQYLAFDACVEVVCMLIATPVSSNQEFLDSGFEMWDFLYRSQHSELWDRICTDFQNQIKDATMGEPLDVEVTRSGTDVNIDLVYNNVERANVTVSKEQSEIIFSLNGERLRDIILK